MKDKNGREIKTGDVVRISDAYFKNDNGLYFVTSSPGDPSWWGNDHSLTKICRNGKISTAKYNIAFWPLVAFCSDRDKNAAACEWNREHAEIEIVDGVNRDGIREYFDNKVKEIEPHMERAKWDWGKHSHEYVNSLKIIDFYTNIAASC